MQLDIVEKWVRRAAAAGALLAFIAIYSGVFRGLRHARGQMVGGENTLARAFARGSVPLYLAAGALGFGSVYLLWRPIRDGLSAPIRLVALILGSLLYFPGLALMVWGRLAMGEMHNVSTSVAVQLYADHRLVTSGPLAWMRHPMYVGGILAELGALLLYRTWATLLMATNIPVLIRRARIEEVALATRFGEQWEEYRRRVPMWVPRTLR